jgi:hypothetical protein
MSLKNNQGISPARPLVGIGKRHCPDKDKIKKALVRQRDKDRELVKGIFRFHEVPGGTMSFVFRAYKKDPVERYDLVDGQVYTLPLGVAKHLNKNCWYPVHAYQQDENGKPSINVGRKVHRCSFQSLEFIDIEGLEESAIEEVVIENKPVIG